MDRIKMAQAGSNNKFTLAFIFTQAQPLSHIHHKLENVLRPPLYGLVMTPSENKI
jgi:hypothetical protein